MIDITNPNFWKKDSDGKVVPRNGEDIRTSGKVWSDQTLRTNAIQTQSNGTNMRFFTLTTGEIVFLPGGVEKARLETDGTWQVTGNISDGTTSVGMTEVVDFFNATDITGAEAETLTDGSDADALHTHTFINLTDTPASFSSQGNKMVIVNAGETGLAFQLQPVVPDAFVTWTPDLGANIVADSVADTATFTSESSSINISGAAATDTMNFDVDLTHNYDWTGSHVFAKLAHTQSGLDIALPGTGNMKPVFIVDAVANDPGLFFYRPSTSIGQVYLGPTNAAYHLFDILGSGAGNFTAGSNNAQLQYQASTNTLTLANGGGAFAASQMTTAQRNAMTPANGWIIYNTTTNQMEGYINGAWAAM